MSDRTTARILHAKAAELDHRIRGRDRLSELDCLVLDVALIAGLVSDLIDRSIREVDDVTSAARLVVRARRVVECWEADDVDEDVMSTLIAELRLSLSPDEVDEAT